MRHVRWLVVAGAVLASAAAHAQEPLSENTLTLAGAAPARASIEDFAWLAGRWEGEAFGAWAEEIWSPPSAGTMVGTFKLFSGDAVRLYEFFVLVEVEGSVSLRLKHFRPDLVGWEEKDGYVDFPLVRLTAEAAHFDGLTFVRTDPDRIDVYLVIGEGSEAHEEHLVYLRAPLPGPTGTD